MATAPFDDAEVDELAEQLLRHLPFAAEDVGDELAAPAGAASDLGVVVRDEGFHGDLGLEGLEGLGGLGGLEGLGGLGG